MANPISAESVELDRSIGDILSELRNLSAERLAQAIIQIGEATLDEGLSRLEKLTRRGA